MNGLSRHLKDPLNLILSILLALSLLGAWIFTKDAAGLDYYVAWVSADAVKNNTKNNIYDRATGYKLAVIYRNKADAQQDAPRQKQIARHSRNLYITATPFMYWLTGVFAVGDYERDLSTWHLLSIFFLTASILVMCHLLGYSMATRLAFLLPVVVWFAPFHSDLNVGNVNSFQLGLVGLIIWMQSRSNDGLYLFATSLLISLLVMFKPNLAAIAILFAGGWLVRGQFTKLAISLSGMVTGIITAVLVSSWWLGNASAWLDWANILGKAVGIGAGKGIGNYSVMKQVSGGLSVTGQLILVLFLCLVCLAVFWWGRRRQNGTASITLNNERESIENAWLIAMGCIVAMLASALVWIHYYLLTIPMLIVAFSPWQKPGQMKLLPLLMLRLLPAIAFVALLDTAVRSLFPVDAATYSSVTSMSSVSILFLVGLWQFGYGITGRDDPGQDAAPGAH